MKVFRPPYGSYNNELIDTVYGCDYYPIQWDVDSLDWKNYGVQNIIDTVCNHKSLDCGSIILCHLGAKYHLAGTRMRCSQSCRTWAMR